MYKLLNLNRTETVVMIYLISNCTNAKKCIADNILLFRNYTNLNLNEAVTKWIENRENDSTNSLESRKMYKGTSWNSVLESEKNFSKLDNTTLLVSSAGYGLIDANTKIKSYGITFAKKHDDSIPNIKGSLLEGVTTSWWDNINKFKIETLQANSVVFIAVSYEYLIAMENTINKLIKKFDKKVFIIVLSQKKLPIVYKNHILKFDTRFNTYEKGTLNSIIARFMRWLSNEICKYNLEFNHIKLQNHIDTFLEKFDLYTTSTGRQISDNEISKIINNQIKNKKIMSKTSGLRDIRTMGFACEQKRYGNLFKKTIEGLK